MNSLVDMSVVVDLLRGYAPAVAWLSDQTNLGVPRVVWIEVIEGASSRAKQDQALKMLRRFELVETTAEEVVLAVAILVEARLAHGVDGYDCMIAAASKRLNLVLYTRNLKHFVPLLGELAIKPY